EADCAQGSRACGHRNFLHRLERLRVSPGVGDSGIAGDAPRQTAAFSNRQRLEALLDPFVHVTESLLQAQHLLANDLETEMARLDDAGVNGTDRNLVHAIPGDANERVLFLARLPLRRCLEVALQWEAIDRPRCLPRPGPLVVGIALDAS